MIRLKCVEVFASNFAFCDYEKQNVNFSRWIHFEIWRFFRTNHLNLCDGNWILYRIFDELIQNDVGTDQNQRRFNVYVEIFDYSKTQYYWFHLFWMKLQTCQNAPAMLSKWRWTFAVLVSGNIWFFYRFLFFYTFFFTIRHFSLIKLNCSVKRSIYDEIMANRCLRLRVPRTSDKKYLNCGVFIVLT